MITGIGTDIVEIARIAKMLEDHGKSFTEKIFTENEIKECEIRKNRAVYLAGRWAAKEALSKALGTGFGKKCSWRDVEILNNKNGKPEIKLSGTAEKTAEDQNVAAFHISISHETHYATATVILEN